MEGLSWCSSPGLLTDLYQLTMAQGYWSSGASRLEASFYMSFRENPFGGGYSVFAGLEPALTHIQALRFGPEDLAFLAGQHAVDGTPLFAEEFLKWLAGFRFSGDVDAVAEGSVVFPGEPVVRVTGPMIDCQLVETALLNVVNFQTLVATKASRVCRAAQGDPVVEFGLRRAQGPDGGLSASRAAYIGGCSATSNTLAARAFGIPAAGTHAHSWVMAFRSEQEAFDEYAKALPNNCTFLVDTYDTLRGVERAISTGLRLRESGHEMLGIRIDSGDLAWLSIRARKMLDDAGFPDAHIVASNELDEHLIGSLKEQGAAIDVWGVGTKLVTAHDQPALGGVYKLSAIRESDAAWEPKLKVSEQTAKITVPGRLGVRRFEDSGKLVGDMVYEIDSPPSGDTVMVDPADPTRRKSFDVLTSFRELLEPVMRSGKLQGRQPELAAVRRRATEEVSTLDATQTRFLNPHSYPVGLERSLHDSRMALILKERGVEE